MCHTCTYHTHRIQIIHRDGIHSIYTTISYLHTPHTPHKSQVTQTFMPYSWHTTQTHSKGAHTLHIYYTLNATPCLPHTFAHTHACMHTYKHMCIHMHAQPYIQTHVRTHMYTPPLHTVGYVSPMVGTPERGGGIRPDMRPIFPNQSQRSLLMGSLRTATVLFEAVDQQQWRDHIWGVFSQITLKQYDIYFLWHLIIFNNKAILFSFCFKKLWVPIINEF